MTNRNENSYPWIHIDERGGTKILPQLAYIETKSTNNILISDKGNMYIYDEKIYRILSQRELKCLIKELFPIEFRKKQHWEAVCDELKTDSPDILEFDMNNDESIIIFENGVLNLNTNELLAHSPKFLSTRKIQANFNSELTLDDAPVFKAYLDNLCGEDDQTKTFLLEYMGGVFSNVKGHRFKKLLLLVGAGNTGKTQLRQLVISLLGEENSISIDMHKINERFGAATLLNKRLAGSGDMSYVNLNEVDIIKGLTGGDHLFAEFKGKDGFSFCYNGFLWFNANRLPYFRGDRGQQVYERFNIVRCSHIVPEHLRDPQLLDKLLMEKEAIISICVKALVTAIKRGYKFTESESMKNERKQYEIENNSLLTFVKDCCIIGQGEIRRPQFIQEYFNWCQINLTKPERARDIGNQLLTAFGISAKKKNGYFVYELTLKSEELYDTDNYINHQLRQLGQRFNTSNNFKK